MNKMHSLAKIVLVVIALYITYFLCMNLLYILLASHNEPFGKSPVLNIVFFLVVCLFLLTILYQCLYRRDRWAGKIVGSPDLPEPESRIQWLPVAFRLVVVAAGFFYVYSSVIAIISITRRYAVTKAGGYISPYSPTVEQIFAWLILLAVGIYLLCGAPHFVRWQIKKTLEQCKQPPNNN